MTLNVDGKAWYTSQAVWGGVAAVGAGLGGAYWGWMNKDPTAISAGLSAAFGGVMAVVGRFKATDVLGKVVASVAK